MNYTRILELNLMVCYLLVHFEKSTKSSYTYICTRTIYKDITHSTQSNFSFVAIYSISKITHNDSCSIELTNLARSSWAVVPEPGHCSNLSNTQSVPLYHLNR